MGMAFRTDLMGGVSPKKVKETGIDKYLFVYYISY